MAQETKNKLDNIDLSNLSDKEKRDLILSVRRLGGKKGSQKRPAPTTDDELWDYIRDEYNYEIPRVAVCEDHTAPFDYVADYIFERYKSILVLGGRESAKTLNTSIAHCVNSEIKPGCESCTFANIEQQSNKSYTYVKSFLYIKDDNGKKVLKPSIEGEPLRKETKWKSGSKIEILIGTVSGVNSPHPQKVHADEVDLLDDAIWEESRNMASSKKLPDGNEIKAQNIATSTLKSTKGIMQKLMDESFKAEKLGLKPTWKVYKSCVYEVAQEVPCCRSVSQDKRESRLKDLGKDPSELCECNKIVKGEWAENVPRTLDSVCKGKLFRSRGWMAYDDVTEKFVQNTPNKWASQLECRRPMADGLYLPTWSRERYVIKDYEPRPEYGYIWMGIDWGGSSNSTSAILWIQGPLHQPIQVNNFQGSKTVIPQGAYVIFKEIYEAAIGATRLADKVVRQEIQYKNRYGAAWRVKARFADKAGAQQRADWREHNPPLRTQWYLSGKYFDPTVECVQALVSDNLLYADGINAPGICDDFESWRSDNGKEVHDESCLVADTMIKTNKGNIPIKDIIAGDMVYTRGGLRRVEWSGPTGVRELKRVEFSDGRLLIGTDNHPVWVKNKGWVNLSLLRPCDIIEAWDDKFILNEKLLPTEMYLGIDGQNQTNGVRKHTIMDLLMEKVIHIIDNFGKILMVKSPKGVRFIIQTLIMIIIQLRILFVLQRGNTQRYIGGQKEATGERDHLSTKKRYQKRLRKTATHREVKNPDLLVVKILGSLRLYYKSFVLYAKKNFSPSTLILNSVKRNANCYGIRKIILNIKNGLKTEIIQSQKRQGNALFVKKILRLINIRKSKPAPVSVLRVSNVINALNKNCEACVYDITVEKDHEFYANGILVHNSHGPAGVRYALKNAQGIVKRYKSNTRQTLQPMIVGRNSADNVPGALAAVAVESPSSADYASERWRESLGGPAAPGMGNNGGGKQPWEP